jgi:DUF2075 family protein
MIVYSETKNVFILDNLRGKIQEKIENLYVRETGHRVSRQELNSWAISMRYMKDVLEDTEIPDDVGVAIEYKIPQTSKRIDFIITGSDQNNTSSAILIELKQWSEGITISDKDAVVNAAFYGCETPHPSYQAWSYASLLNDYNAAVQEKSIKLTPCAYLHNYPEEANTVNNSVYSEWTQRAPVFFREDLFKLREFVKKYVKYGDAGSLMYVIEKGKIRPSKSLADSLHSMLEGNNEFTLIDNQKIVYETAIKLATSKENTKKVMVVKGGPGTGKSVVAINLLSELTSKYLNTQYVTRNSAPREVFQYMLTGKFTKSRITNLFTSSGAFTDVEDGIFDALIVDEAHRLTEKSGLFSNKGNNQIDELIKSSKTSIFFLDEDQRIHIKDIGELEEIKKWALKNNADYYEYELESQFRCNGSDGYLAWTDDVLGIKKTANITLKDLDYDFKVFDNPKLLHEHIAEINLINNKSRMLAGYCWNWVSKNNISLKDIVIDDYAATWNLSQYGQSFIVQPKSVTEVGCIHTCQGLELDYAGVIMGPDLIVRDGEVYTDVTKRAKTDKSIFGYKKMLREEPDRAEALVDMIIRNTYRVLLTRGMKGTFIYCTDPETQEYFKARANSFIGDGNK